ncbi:MAG: gamma-glutamyl-gamma-aminobutyrate hydrolase family protein [Candidatus Sericytochromatia bacterium]|nr:gamma-glutamyl-gamma-aminobutyrate hydrolase family protein [Candidatus Sericytochromatia bacterium]
MTSSLNQHPWLAITQRVEIDAKTGERRDALDQRWVDFILLAGFLPLLLPNSLAAAQALLAACRVQGIVLTGGNSLQSCGGNAPERDELEFWLLNQAPKQHWPLLGVCRGMQVIQSHLGVALEPVSDQILALQTIQISGKNQVVNSYHSWGTRVEHPELKTWAQTEDGMIKAIKHIERPWWGIMWHPERLTPFRSEDLTLFREIFKP